VNCPSCGGTLIFGAVSCDCGYTRVPGEPSTIELSYVEALFAYWRIYWPSQLFSFVAYVPFLLLQVQGRVYKIEFSAAEQFGLQIALGAVGLFMYVHRAFSSRFRHLVINVITDSPDAPNARLTVKRRVQLWFFLWWRQLVATLLALFLSAPANTLLSLFGIHAVFGVNTGFLLSMIGAILVIGPILLKMVIGHQFQDFRLEVERFRERT